jgi:glycosyltransferase involved in cell wall biosynthesis
MISILLPIYNGIEFIDESIQSIRMQTYTEWELLIGINGHGPNSKVYQQACAYSSDKIRVYDFHTISNKSDTLNALIPYCNFDYIALIDVDDIWLPTKLMMQSLHLIKYDVVGTKCVYFGDRIGCPDIPTGDISHYNFLINPIINSSSILKKELCYWDNTHNGVEDYDLWLKLKQQSKTFFNCNEVLVQHRLHKLSAFNNTNHANVHDLLVKYKLV